MNEFSAWMQDNWYSVGSLLAQIAFLFAGVWFARKILKSLRATQQQFGAMLKLSMTNGMNGLEEHSSGLEEHSKPSETTSHRPSVDVAEDRPTPYVMAEWPAVKRTPSLSEELSGRAVTTSTPMTATEDAAPDTTPYVAAPLTLAEESSNGGHLAAAGRGVVRWLQTPMASSSGPSPWRKVIRWLQAPARS